MNKKIAVIGGDMRQAMLGSLLHTEGFDVCVFGTGKDDDLSEPYRIQNVSELSSCGVIILPMPVMKDASCINAPLHNGDIPLSSIMDNVSSSAVILGGKLPQELLKKYKSLRFYDYLEREDFAVKNAVATAEGAIALAVNETPFTIWDSRCLVIGYGRIGKTLVRLLKSMGARVDACARKCSDRAWLETLGCDAYSTDTIDQYIGSYDLIFNTVPEKLINETALAKVPCGSLVIDLASKPGGVDFEAARTMNKNVIWALSLPGKVAPLTSGKILKDTIINILNETNE